MLLFKVSVLYVVFILFTAQVPVKHAILLEFICSLCFIIAPIAVTILLLMTEVIHLDLVVLQLNPVPQPLKTDGKGRVNFGVFTLTAKR